MGFSTDSFEIFTLSCLKNKQIVYFRSYFGEGSLEFTVKFLAFAGTSAGTCFVHQIKKDLGNYLSPLNRIEYVW